MGGPGPEGEASEVLGGVKKQESQVAQPWGEQSTGGHLPLMGPALYSGRVETALCPVCIWKLYGDQTTGPDSLFL